MCVVKMHLMERTDEAEGHRPLKVISLGDAIALSKTSWITEKSVHAGFQRTSSTITNIFLWDSLLRM